MSPLPRRMKRISARLARAESSRSSVVIAAQHGEATSLARKPRASGREPDMVCFVALRSKPADFDLPAIIP